MPGIVVVEDEKGLLDVLTCNLKAADREVIVSVDGAGVLELAGGACQGREAHKRPSVNEAHPQD